MRRVSSRQRLVSWDAFDATVPSPSSGNDHVHDNHDDDDNDTASLSDYETCYDTLPASMSRVNSISSNLSQEADALLMASSSTSLLKRKRTTRIINSKQEPPRSAAISVATALASTTTSTTSPPPAVIPTLPWEVVVAPTSSFDSAQQQDEYYITPPTTPSNDSKPEASTVDASTTASATSMTASESAATTSKSNLLALPDDVQLHLLSFLSVHDIRKMIQTGHSYHDLIASEEANGLWNDCCHRQWPYLKSASDVELVDTLDISSKISSSSTSDSTMVAAAASRRPNLNLLLGLASQTSAVPTAIDKALFVPSRWTRNLRGRVVQIRRTVVSELEELTAPNGRLAVQFTGHVGMGDRCIRANEALPRPKLLTKLQLRKISQSQRHDPYYFASSSTSSSASSSTHGSNSSLSSSANMLSTSPPSCGGSILQRLRRTSRCLTTSSQSKPVWQPFCAPFYVRSSDDSTTTVSVTPRLVAYYEVSILQAPQLSAEEIEQRRRNGGTAQQPHRAPWRLASSTECVAVGLCRQDFSLHTRMPGWDACSYGYHGDDGGIFHNAGHMIRPFGPKFGVGDVVGCGVDYQEQQIFYTLNGTFLGYAFDKLDKTVLEQEAFYPVVGMDTNCLVQVNFGTDGQPFQYNLHAKMASHKQVICEALRPMMAGSNAKA